MPKVAKAVPTPTPSLRDAMLSNPGGNVVATIAIIGDFTKMPSEDELEQIRDAISSSGSVRVALMRIHTTIDLEF